MCGKAPFHSELGLQRFEACGPHVCVPSNWCNFDLRREIEGFIRTYVMTQKYNIALLRLRRDSLCKCVSACCNPMYLHPRRTRSCQGD